jgi:hypothetical protein
MIRDVASQRIDPSAFFRDPKGNLNFTVAIGALLMGASGALASQDGRNHGLEALNAMIDRDIQTQEKNIASKRAAIGQRQSIYAQMREELGDKILADEKYRAAALESAKNRILAFSAGSDSKIDKARTAQAVAALDKEQQEALLTFDQRALAMSQQQAAASASARAHQAQQQFENVIRVRELGIKEQDAETRRIEATGKPGVETAKRTSEYANKMQDAKIPQAEASLAAFKSRLPKPGQDIPGTGIAAGARSALPRWAPGSLDSDERINRNHLEQMFNDYRTAVTGAGGSAEEIENIRKSLFGAGTTAELWDAVAKMESGIKGARANIDAGYGPDVVGAYKANRKAQGNEPLDVRRGLK